MISEILEYMKDNVKWFNILIYLPIACALGVLLGQWIVYLHFYYFFGFTVESVFFILVFIMNYIVGALMCLGIVIYESYKKVKRRIENRGKDWNVCR